jgi:RNA polymerase sigma factor
MTAFSEALHTYEINKGPFLSFANLVIRRRITDHIRSDARFFCERSVDPSAFHGQIDEDAEDAALQTQVLSRTVGENDGCVRLEIEAVGEILLKYGFSFYALVSNSPKSKKTKESCATVIRCLLEKPLLISATRNGGALPAKTISTCTGVNRKILERHRKYIIASMEILTGDFPFLAEYLSHIKTK